MLLNKSSSFLFMKYWWNFRSNPIKNNPKDMHTFISFCIDLDTEAFGVIIETVSPSLLANHERK